MKWSTVFFSDDYFLPKKGVAILHEYLVECYQEDLSQLKQLEQD